jgi:2-haloacid dehalogenase
MGSLFSTPAHRGSDGGAFLGRGFEVGNAWRTRQFEYTWLRTLTGTYVDFWHVTGEALTFTAKLLAPNASAIQPSGAID